MPFALGRCCSPVLLAVAVLCMTLVSPSAQAAPTAQTQTRSVIRAVTVTAPASPTLLGQSLRSLRGKPVTPDVQRVASQRLEAIALQRGWTDIRVSVGDTLDDQGTWSVEITATLPRRARRQRDVPPTIAPPQRANAIPDGSAPEAITSRQFQQWRDTNSYQVLIVRESRTLYAKLSDGVHAFPVALGRSNSPTPTGAFQVQAIAQQPTWFPTKNIRARAAARGRELPMRVPPGPSNPLGDWFVALGQSIGIHGTNAPASIGRFVSSGCIRMNNPAINAIAPRLRAGDGVLIVDALDGIVDARLLSSGPSAPTEMESPS